MRQPVRQLDQRQRVPACLGDDPVANPSVQRARDHRLEHGPRVVVGQTGNGQLREAAELRAFILIPPSRTISVRIGSAATAAVSPSECATGSKSWV